MSVRSLPSRQVQRRAQHEAQKRSLRQQSGKTRKDRKRGLETLIASIVKGEFGKAAELFDDKRDILQTTTKRVRHHILAAGVQIYYQIRDDEACRARFRSCFEVRMKRPLKDTKLLRDALLFTLGPGEGNTGMAGTDARALKRAVNRDIPAVEIPAYIKKHGGLDSLLRAARRAEGEDDEVGEEDESGEESSVPVWLRIQASPEEAKALLGGPSEGIWACLKPKRARTGAPKSLILDQLE